MTELVRYVLFRERVFDARDGQEAKVEGESPPSPS